MHEKQKGGTEQFDLCIMSQVASNSQIFAYTDGVYAYSKLVSMWIVGEWKENEVFSSLELQ